MHLLRPTICQPVKTRIGIKFIRLIDKNFDPNNPYHKLLNIKTLKLSYCCVPNIKAVTSRRNKRYLNMNSVPTPTSNCSTEKSSRG